MTIIGAIHNRGIAVLSLRFSELKLLLPVERWANFVGSRCVQCRLSSSFPCNKVISSQHRQKRNGKKFVGSIQKYREQHTESVIPASPNSGIAGQKKGLVYVSSSADPFANLAFEDWVHDNWDLSKLNLLFLWRNEPSVVIGRHQNPWTECNIRELMTTNMKLARRRSGGGTVYHDLGNVNCTFFTHRKSYDRHLNLQMMVDGMKEGWPSLDIHISPRDDLMLNHFYKISGSAARLSRKIAYHHCTLLHSANTRVLSSLLNVDADGIKSNATESVKTPVLNLREAEHRLSQDQIIEAIAKEFYSKNPPYCKDKVYTISPTDEKTWSGIRQKKEELMAWDWIYGKTPKFHVEKKTGEVSAVVHVSKGLIEGVVLQMPFGWIDALLVQHLTSVLKGKRFWITDVAMTIDTFLNEVEVEDDVREKLETLRRLIEDCIS